MLSAGVLLTSFQTMAMSVTAERDDGTLKRLRATPMPPVAYFFGKVGLVAVSSTLQVALLLLVARLAFGVELPTTADRWAVFALVFALGVFGGTVLGIAYSSMATARTVGAVVIGPMLVLQFISGVYIAFDDVPQWLQQVAVGVPAEVDRPGHALGVLPRPAGLGRDGRVLGDRPHGDGPVRLGRGWAGGVRAHLQVVQARHHVSPRTRQ